MFDWFNFFFIFFFILFLEKQIKDNEKIKIEKDTIFKCYNQVLLIQEKYKKEIEKEIEPIKHIEPFKVITHKLFTELPEEEKNKLIEMIYNREFDGIFSTFFRTYYIKSPPNILCTDFSRFKLEVYTENHKWVVVSTAELFLDFRMHFIEIIRQEIPRLLTVIRHSDKLQKKYPDAIKILDNQLGLITGFGLSSDRFIKFRKSFEKPNIKKSIMSIVKESQPKQLRKYKAETSSKTEVITSVS
jgi:hypothetical protein